MTGEVLDRPQCDAADHPEPEQESVVIDGHGSAWQRGPCGWEVAGVEAVYTWDYLSTSFLPLTVVWTPE